MPAIAQMYFTVDEVLAFPDDGNRYELVYGKLLVSPSPSFRHQRVLGRLFRLIADYCDRHAVGVAMTAPADVTWGRDDVLAQPDIFVIAPEDGHLRKWSDLRHLSLIAEVLSPSTKNHDRYDKRGVYRDREVATYWVVDAEDDFVEVWSPVSRFPVFERERLVWHPVGAAEPLVIALGTLFDR